MLIIYKKDISNQETEKYEYFKLRRNFLLF